MIIAKLSVTLLFRPVNEKYYPVMMNRCCNVSCSNIIIDKMKSMIIHHGDIKIEVDNAETRCQKITDVKEIYKLFGNIELPSTLIGWPGDQDRFNNLFFNNQDIMFRPWNRNQEDIIPSWYTSNLGEEKPRKMLLHWCDEIELKSYFGKILSLQLEKKLNKPGENWERYAWKVLNDTIFSTGYHGFGSPRITRKKNK